MWGDSEPWQSLRPPRQPTSEYRPAVTDQRSGGDGEGLPTMTAARRLSVAAADWLGIAGRRLGIYGRWRFVEERLLSAPTGSGPQ